jgi:hypothetical protein
VANPAHADGAPLTGPGSELNALRRRLRWHRERVTAERWIASADASVAQFASERWSGLTLERGDQRADARDRRDAGCHARFDGAARASGSLRPANMNAR